MPLRWVNIRSGEKVVTETEPHTAALWASSDHSPNITQGQDYGWRLAPEIVVQLKRIKQDLPTLERIAARFKKGLEDLKEYDILYYISNQTKLESVPEPEVDQYQDEYDNEIRKLEGKTGTEAHNLFDEADKEVKKVEAAVTMSTEELEAELARRKGTTSTTTEVPSTTTTTTVAPDPTTTTSTTVAPEQQS